MQLKQQYSFKGEFTHEYQGNIRNNGLNTSPPPKKPRGKKTKKATKAKTEINKAGNKKKLIVKILVTWRERVKRIKKKKGKSTNIKVTREVTTAITFKKS